MDYEQNFSSNKNNVITNKKRKSERVRQAAGDERDRSSAAEHTSSPLSLEGEREKGRERLSLCQFSLQLQ